MQERQLQSVARYGRGQVPFVSPQRRRKNRIFVAQLAPVTSQRPWRFHHARSAPNQSVTGSTNEQRETLHTDQ
jgi:hypothetical protein